MKIFKRFSKLIGPGVITGIADDDPSGIATYSQTGAAFGLTQLWLALYTYPFMVAIQEMCGRIGMVTGKGLAGIIKSNYSKPVLYFAVLLLVIANTINIGADLGAMAESLRLITPLSFFLSLILILAFTVFGTVFIPYNTYVKVLKWLALSVGAYIVTALLIKHDWGLIVKSLLVPHIEWNREFILNVTAMLGTTISPYLFFWQATQEVEEEVAHKKIRFFGRGVPKINNKDLKEMRKDTLIGMGVSNLVTFFIIITSASALHGSGITGIASATQMATALEPLLGPFALTIFCIGILGTGLLAVPVLAGSLGYAVAESFGSTEGLARKFKEARGFYSVIIAALIVGALINLFNIDPIALLYYSAAANGMLAAPLMVLILLIANNKKILGDKTNGRWSNVLGWTITAIMGGMAVLTIVSFV
jgi:NRAMP (natural resistance-associated macrophage protein)-like metal ion transporter